MRMAASTAKGPCKMMALALLLIGSIFSAGVAAQEDDIAAATAPSLENARGDMIPVTTPAPESADPQGQIIVLPSMTSPDPIEPTTEAAATGEGGEAGDEERSRPGETADQGIEVATEVHSVKPEIVPQETPAPLPPRGDGPNNAPRPVPQDDVVCVSKEAVQDKNAVSLKLKAVSNCEDTKVKIESVLQELCGEDCKLEIYQEQNSDQILVSGPYVEEDVAGMANKFNNDNIKDKTDVEDAVPRWGKNSKLVLVSLLLTGLLLAALLVAGYYLKTHRKNSKGVRLAESFQVDEENQANTLVSVAPLPQEPLDKPTTNGESPPENGTNPAPTTNGHSASQTPVADTEM